MIDDDNIVQHISKFFSLSNQLVGINAKVDVDDLKAILSNSMPPSYGNIVFTLNKIHATLEEILFTLIDERAKKIESANCTVWKK